MFTGETKRLHVQVFDREGNPFDLSDIAQIQWEMQRDLTTDSGADLHKELGSGITIINAVEGRFRIEILPADTTSMAGQYYHEGRIYDALGNVATIFVGHAVLTKTAIG